MLLKDFINKNFNDLANGKQYKIIFKQLKIEGVDENEKFNGILSYIGISKISGLDEIKIAYSKDLTIDSRHFETIEIIDSYLI